MTGSSNDILILVVDDEALIQLVLDEALQEGGYHVVIAHSGEDAAAVLDARFADIRALLTDIDLQPGALTGWDVARHGRELKPGLPVIYMTGASAAQWNANGVPGSVLLQKPFAMAQALTAVSQLLNDAAAARGVTVRG